MAATDTSGVKIVINVVDANSGEVVSRVSKNLDQIGMSGAKAGKQVTDGLNATGAAGTRAGLQVGEGFKEMGGHALSALDNVRLLRDDLGIRIPRAMENVIARSSALSGAIGAIGTGLVALGAIEIAVRFGKEIYDFYDKLQDVNGEMRKFAAQAGINAQQKLFDSSSIEQVNAMLQQNSKLLDANASKQKRAGVGDDNKGSIAQYITKASVAIGLDDASVAGPIYNKQDDAEKARLTANDALLKERQDAINAKRSVDQQEAKATADGMRLKGRAADAAARQDKLDLDRLKQAQEQKAAYFQRDLVAANNALIRRQNPGKKDDELRDKGILPEVPVAKNLGAQQRADDDAAANADYSAKGVAQARKEADEIAHARDEAHAAGLKGEAQYRAQLQSTVNGFQRQVAASEMSSATAHQLSILAKEKFDDEYVERYKTQLRETERMESEARSAGLTGLAKSDAELGQRQRAIDQGVVDTTIDPELAQRQKQAAAATAAAEGTKLQSDFIDHIKQMDDSRANSSMSANARVLADTRRTIGELQKAFDSLYGGLAVTDPRRAQGQQALNGEKGRISADAAKEIQRNNQQLADQTADLQDQAMRGGGGNRNAEQYRAVESELAQHLRRLTELKQQAGEDDIQAQQQYAQQEQAYRQIAYNKELDLAREQRDKLAGQLKGFMSNPLEALKRQGEDMASKAAADLLLGHLPGSSAGPGNKGGGLFGGGADAIFRPFHKGSGNGSGIPGNTDHDAASVIAPEQATVNATTATINVGSVSFSGGGNGAGNPSAAVRGIASGGYVATGNGGFFNTGSGSSAPGGGSDSASNGEAGSPAYSAKMPGSAGSFGGAPSISTSPSMGSEDPAQASQRIYGGAQQISSMGKDLGVFGNDADGGNAGIMSKIPGLKDMDSKQLGQLGGTVGGALGVLSAFEGKGGVMGGLQGALSGAEMGAQYGGPIGAAIGAVGGAVLGFIGHGARVQAQQYWFKELMPKAQQDMLGFESGTTDYQSAYDDLTSMETSAKQRTKSMGPGAEDYYNDTIKPRIDDYMQRLTREQKAGRSQFGMSAAQSHNGGYVGGFGSMATSSTEGWLHAERGEFMLNQRAAMSHADVASMMNAGVSRSDIGDYLGGGSTQRPVESGGDTHLHVHTMDVKGVRDFLSSYKHDIRGAVNQSYAENSGGAD